MTTDTETKFKPALINTIRAEDTYSDIKNALRDSADFLRQFCGPFALNAGTVSAAGTAMVDNFTKDGVTIYSHLSAETPVEETARRLIEFIGTRVDRRCHDGTTTSMMTASTLGYHWMDALAPQTRRQRAHMAETISEVTARFKDTIEKYSFTVSDLIEEVRKVKPDVDEDALRRRVFYDTIMTSSKGDEELAEKLTTVLESLPEELYSFARFEQNNIESDTRFEIKEQPSDFNIRGSYAGNFSLTPGNKEMGSRFEFEEADLVVSPNALIDNQAETTVIVSWIVNQLLPRKEDREVDTPVVDENGHPVLDPETNEQMIRKSTQKVTLDPETKLKRPMVILAPNFETTVIRAINTYNSLQETGETKIYPFQYFQEHPLSYHALANAIVAVAGDGQYKTVAESLNEFTIETSLVPCKFEHAGSLMDISNLYKKDGRRFHPFYYDESKTRYHTLIKDMQETIENNSKRHLDSNKRAEKFMYDLIYIQRCMICQNIIEMQVCGTTHELIANISVVEDAMGSAMSVVEEGVVLSGYQKLLSDLLKDPEDNEMLTATCNALREVIAAAFDITADDVNTYIQSLVHFDGAEDKKFLYNNAFDDAPFAPRNAITEFADGTSNAIFQPKAGFLEQFSRIEDIVTKLVMTYAVLTERRYSAEAGR